MTAVKSTDNLQTALRLVLHAAGWDELLPGDDYGDDLFDEGLLRTTVLPDGTQQYDLTPMGEQMVLEATGVVT